MAHGVRELLTLVSGLAWRVGEASEKVTRPPLQSLLCGQGPRP